jgi:hypothetical protein
VADQKARRKRQRRHRLINTHKKMTTMSEQTTDTTTPETEASNEVHARLEFTAAEDGSVNIGIEALPLETNPAVHFACWLYENREALAAMAKRDFNLTRAREAAERVIISGARRIAGPDGSPLN